MAADLGYTHEKMGPYVQILATHPGPIKQRLIAAFNSLYGVNPNAMPEEPRAIWNRIWAAVTSAPHDGTRGAFTPSIERLTDAEACSIARDIMTVDALLDVALREGPNR